MDPVDDVATVLTDTSLLSNVSDVYIPGIVRILLLKTTWLHWKSVRLIAGGFQNSMFTFRVSLRDRVAVRAIAVEPSTHAGTGAHWIASSRMVVVGPWATSRGWKPAVAGSGLKRLNRAVGGFASRSQRQILGRGCLLL